MSKYHFVVGQRVWPNTKNAAHMPGLKPGKVTAIVSEFAIDVLVDGKTEPQQYAKAVWEPDDVGRW